MTMNDNERFTMTFLQNVAAMQIDQTVAAMNDGGYQGINDLVTELVAYCENIRDRRDLTKNYYFALFLANALALDAPLIQRAVNINLFIKSHEFYTTEVKTA